MGYKNPALSELNDGELIDELEVRGYVVYDEDDIPDGHTEMVVDLEKIYLDYMLMSPDFFHKNLRKFFNTHLQKTLHV